jgi:hypothetical protein
MQFTGKLLRAGLVIANGVAGNITEKDDVWEGDLIVAPNGLVVTGQLYTLDLDDGRSRDIMILKVKHASPSVATYCFRGLSNGA